MNRWCNSILGPLINSLNTHDISSVRSYDEVATQSGLASRPALWAVKYSDGCGLKFEPLEWKLKIWQW